MVTKCAKHEDPWLTTKATTLAFFASLGDAFVTYAFLIALFPNLPLWFSLAIAIGTAMTEGEMYVTGTEYVLDPTKPANPYWAQAICYGAAIAWGAVSFTEAVDTLMGFSHLSHLSHIPLGILAPSLAIAIFSAVAFGALCQEFWANFVIRWNRFSETYWEEYAKNHQGWTKISMALTLFLTDHECAIKNEDGKLDPSKTKIGTWGGIALFLGIALSVGISYPYVLAWFDGGQFALGALFGHHMTPLLGHVLFAGFIVFALLLPCMVAFTTVNSLTSIYQCIETLQKEKKPKKERIIQWPPKVFLVNPLFWLGLIITKTAKMLFFLFHLLSEALTTANSTKGSRLFSLLLGLLGALSEALTDIPYLFFESTHDHHNHSGHSHNAAFTGTFLKIVLSPLIFICTLMHYCFSDGTALENSMNTTLSYLSLKHA